MTMLVTAEIRKILTLRFWWALALVPLFAALFTGSLYGSISDHFDDDIGDDVALAALLVSVLWVALFAGLFGALNAGGEYRHGTLTPTFLTARGRDGVLGAKLGVTAVFGLGYAAAVQLVALVSVLAFGGEGFTVNSGIAGMLIAGLVATLAWTLIGAGLGLLFASSTGAAVALVAWCPIGEFITRGILFAVGLESVGKALPGSLTVSMLVEMTTSTDEFVATPIAVPGLLAWTAAGVGLGWWITRRRDIS